MPILNTRLTARLGLAVIAAAALAATATAHAQILATGSYAANFSSVTTPAAVPLQQTGNTSLPFTTTQDKELVSIVFNAECGIFGTVGAWTSASVYVDSVLARPSSDTSFALCTAALDSSYTWVGAVRQAIYVVPKAGPHKVEVIGNVNNGGTSMWFGDVSIVVSH